VQKGPDIRSKRRGQHPAKGAWCRRPQGGGHFDIAHYNQRLSQRVGHHDGEKGADVIIEDWV